MFTDMVGSTAAAQANEEVALRLRDEQQELVVSRFSAHQGREVKSMGDGILAEFDSALRAVQCAIDIQQCLHERNAQKGLASIQLRIGIHLGDVEVRGSDIFGDSVNVASRVEPLAEPGGICISEPVFTQVRGKLPNTFTRLPPVELKNVRFPMEIYRVDLPWERTAQVEPGHRMGTAPRLAVLPLANMSPDPQDEYFADGLTEEIISELSTVPGLRVIARTSVMRFRGGVKGVSDIGRDLRVGTVLEGSVRRAGNRIRITAQLVEAATEEPLWSGRYDRELVDIFAIQNEIAKEVAAALHVALPLVPPGGGRRPPSMSGLKAYLRGRHQWNRRTEAHVLAALRSFEEALRLDPAYAQAYSGIADCYSILVDWGSILPREGSPKAKAAAGRALELNEAMAEAHASMGLALTREYDWDGADREFKRSVELNPMYASAHQWYYMNLLCRGRRAEAARELELAEEADPLSPIILFHRGFFSWVRGDAEGAVSHWDRVTELGEELGSVTLHKLVFLACQSRRAEALEILPRLSQLDPGLFGEAAPAIAHAFLGQREEASRELEVLLATAKERYVPSFRIAWVYAGLGDSDKFFEWLLRSADEMGNGPYEFLACPAFERLRGDSRFQGYLQRCHLAR